MALIKINGRAKFFNRIKSVTKIAAARYAVETYANGSFHVEGGKKSGGGRNEWFLDGFGSSPINCTSLLDALRCIDTA